MNQNRSTEKSNTIKRFAKFAVVLIVFCASCVLSGCREEDIKACIEVSDVEVRVNEVIYFSSCTEDASFYEWNLDDDFFSNDRHVNHVYSKAGTYEVTLYVESDFSSDEEKIFITVNP